MFHDMLTRGHKLLNPIKDILGSLKSEQLAWLKYKPLFR